MPLACLEPEIYRMIQLAPNEHCAMNPRYLELNDTVDTVFDTVILKFNRDCS